VAEWQTRSVEVAVPARASRFKSGRAYVTEKLFDEDGKNIARQRGLLHGGEPRLTEAELALGFLLTKLRHPVVYVWHWWVSRRTAKKYSIVSHQSGIDYWPEGVRASVVYIDGNGTRRRHQWIRGELDV
jgi:hypothetical protein